MTQVRDAEAKVWAAKWSTGDRSKVSASASDCLGWAASIGAKVNSGELKEPGQATYDGPYSFAKVPPSDMGRVTADAFDSWFKMGALTPSDVKEGLRRDTEGE